MLRAWLTDVGVACDFPENVDLFGRGFSQFLHLLGGYVTGCDIDNLHGIFLLGCFVNAPTDNTAHPPARDNTDKMGVSIPPCLARLHSRAIGIWAGWYFHVWVGFAVTLSWWDRRFWADGKCCFMLFLTPCYYGPCSYQIPTGRSSYQVLEWVKQQFAVNKLYLPKTSFGSYFS